jgi:hypothetical protein
MYLFFIMCIGTGYNWQKYALAYAYGFRSPGQFGNPKFEITAEYPDLVTYYPILAGTAVLLPEIFFGIFMGTITDLVPSRVK